MIAEDTNEEKFFRERYSIELRKKDGKQLDDEALQIKQQNMRTPGRRGEQIKREEIDKEILRRINLGRQITNKH